MEGFHGLSKLALEWAGRYGEAHGIDCNGERKTGNTNEGT